MSISRQIGGTPEEQLLYQILKQLERLTKQMAQIIVPTTTTTTTLP